MVIDTKEVRQECQNEAVARLRESLLEASRAVQREYVSQVPPSIEEGWHEALDAKSFAIPDVPRIEDIKPFVMAIVAIRHLILAETNEERDAAAGMLVRAAELVSSYTFADDAGEALVPLVGQPVYSGQQLLLLLVRPQLSGKSL